MKKVLLYAVTAACCVLGSVESAAAQSYCTAGSNTVCSTNGAADGQARGRTLCDNQPERTRVSQDYWNRAEQAQAQGRSDDYAYFSAYSDAVVSGGCPSYGVQPTKKNIPAADTRKAVVSK